MSQERESQPRTRMAAEALLLIRKLEDDLRRIRCQCSSEESSERVSYDVNHDLNVIRREVALFMQSLAAAPR